ncbi:MAG: 30S ribosomal protein S13 [Candidatus Woykebacteria bacterium RBG_13_40_7b]|uniref:Small ribosomal subunit protein uS13 n=1 Tax=Candidatus Woykebacteria bacterium RBG_13_40_7b TaxID=1802594 RepID=A0A1G1W7Y0_9BACT|nr:MAG: 30S ribosomal protein S13 [Candidatus Woykebacteria bacterium RBG_13_40_7b]
MARIAGVELPKERKILYALPVIYGVGPTLSRKILEKAKLDANKRVRDLTEEEVSKIHKEVEAYPVEGDLRRIIQENIKRLEDIQAYRGIRHKRGLPARGQRTRSNARTKRGKRITIGAIKKEVLTKVEQQKAKESPAKVKPSSGGK